MTVGTVKLFGLGVRKEGMSPEAFHDHWRHPHGTWGRLMTTLRGYVQSHQMHCDLLGPNQSRFEMVAEMWLDNIKDLREFRQEPVLVKYLIADEGSFIDLSRSVFLATEEETVISGPQGDRLNPGDDLWSHANRPISIKLLQFLSQDNSQPALLDDESIARRLGALRYVRCHPLKAFHGDSPPFSGAREFWWPTVSAFRHGVSNAPEAWDSLRTRSDSTISMRVQAERLV